MTQLEFVAIEYWVGVEPVKMGPALGHFRNGDKGTFFHGYGPGRMLLEKYNILKDYGEISTEDEERLDAVAVQFARDFPLKPATLPRAGWLSPGGDYFPCGARGHLLSAQKLALEAGELGDGEKYLEKKGWMKVYDELVAWPKNAPTQRQLDTLFQLTQLPNVETDFGSAIMEFLSEDWS